MLIVISFVAAIVLLIVSISKWKIHPFLALMGISLLLAIVLKLPLDTIPDIIGKGFASTFTGIGIVIILGMLIGSILEASGAAIKLADVVVKTVGKKHPELAMLDYGIHCFYPRFLRQRICDYEPYPQSHES
jgi:GntP family gluconate:H+ symporter